MKKRILIIDDDPNILDYLDALFKDNCSWKFTYQ